jgi:hypothetical protein
LAELIAECVAKFNERILLADWTVTSGFLTMKLCSAHQIWIGITGIDNATKESKQRCSFIE